MNRTVVVLLVIASWAAPAVAARMDTSSPPSGVVVAGWAGAGSAATATDSTQNGDFAGSVVDSTRTSDAATDSTRTSDVATDNTRVGDHVESSGTETPDSGEDELEAIRRAAEAAAVEKPEKETGGEKEVVFKSGGLSLQKLNPEFSVTGDMLSAWQSGDDRRPAWDTQFRSLELHLQSYLDPYSRFKATIPVAQSGAELEEAYFTRYGVIGGVNLTLGQFKQDFGVVNRWHEHALDTFDFPLALQEIFGGEGLNQLGLSLETSGTTGPVQHGLIAQVTKGDNPLVFAQNADNDPSILAHYRAYVDLSASTYLQVGGTGLWGWNDTWQTTGGQIERSRTVAVYGVDLMLLWEPTSKMRYRNLQWRSEAYFADKGIEAPDGSGSDRIKPWGLYSVLQSKVSRTLELGLRYDYYQPEVRAYLPGDDSLAPWLSEVSGAFRQAFSGWITWWQSPFVKFRGGYVHENGKGTGQDVSTVVLQMVFAAGPHKHDRY